MFPEQFLLLENGEEEKKILDIAPNLIVY